LKILTFVIPAYNSGGFLDKCIGSMLHPAVLEQLEIIVVNDGSTDDTAAVAGEYCRRWPGVVRLITQENRGHGGALNTGCGSATGKYVKVIDADDWVVTENLPAFLAFLEAADSDVVLTHHHTVDISDGRVRPWKNRPPAFGVNYTLAQVGERWPDYADSLTFHGITYNRAFYQKNSRGLTEKVFYEDYEYATFPCAVAETLSSCDLFIYEYRIGDVNQSVSQANQLKRLGHTETVLERMVRQYGLLPAGPGKTYAARKTAQLLLSYFTTTLLLHPDRKAGRALGAAQMAKIRDQAPEIGRMTRKKYGIFRLMSRLHISKETFDRLLESKLYRRLRNKK